MCLSLTFVNIDGIKWKMCTNTNSNAMYVSFSDFTLKAEQTGCLGDEIVLEPVLSIGACAMYCRKQSRVFMFGRSGTYACDSNDGRCRCVCKTVANHQGCMETHNAGYDLYEFNSDDHLQTSNNVKSECFLFVRLFKVTLTEHYTGARPPIT